MSKYVPFDDWYRVVRASPENEGVSDAALIGLYQSKYMGAPQEDEQAPAPAAQQGDFMRGANVAWKQWPMLAGGALYALGDSLGIDSWKQTGLDLYQRKEAEVAGLQRETDSFSGNIERGAGVGDWVDFLQYGLGYTAVQAGEALLTGGIGSAVGKAAAKQGLKAYAEKQIADQMAKGLAREAAEKEAALAVAGRLATASKLGAGTALGAFNVQQEAGQIFPEMAKQAAAEGRDVDGGDRLRAWGSTALAALVETGADMIGLDKLLGGTPGASYLARAARQVPEGMAREAGTEAVQTALERYGAGQEVTSREGWKDIIDSAALGAVGGGGQGVVTSAFRQPEQAPPPAPAPSPIDRLQTATSGDEMRAIALESIGADPEHFKLVGLPEADFRPPLAGAMQQGPVVPGGSVPTLPQAGVPWQGTEPTMGAQSGQLDVGGASPVIDPAALLPEAPRQVAPEPQIDMQNRDRTRVASVAQMQEIARNPDYLRIGPSRSPDTGAPMVMAIGDDMGRVAPEALGNQDVSVMSDGQRVPFRYAVVSAQTVEPSNFADGSPNPAFQSAEPGTLRALNNARVAGMRAAFDQGTAGRYVEELKADAAAHGIAPEVIDRTPNPLLIRVYNESENRPNMAARSQAQGLGMGLSETARQDSSMLTSDVLSAYAGGDILDAGNRDFVRSFVGRLKGAGQDTAGMMNERGELSPAGRTRLQAALSHAAYGNAELVSEMFESNDSDIKAIGEGLKLAAPAWANLRDSVRAGAVDASQDVTGPVIEAVNMIRRARQTGSALYDLSRQADLSGSIPAPITQAALRIFYGGDRLTKAASRERIAARLQEFASYASQVSAGGDMLGGAVSPADILNTVVSEKGNARADLITPGQQPAPVGLAGGAAGEVGIPGRGPGDGGGGPQVAGPGGTGLAEPGPGGQAGSSAVRAALKFSLSARQSPEWVAFPKSSNGLGIPRAEMPQVKGGDRSSMAQFLRARGIEYTQGEQAADELKPTQAEFSPTKVAKWVERRDGDRSVLVSNDGYVLDGHHQWLAAMVTGDPVQTIRFDAPIRELVDAVHEFPSSFRADGGIDLAAQRADAEAAFRAALADLADIFTRNARTTFLDENTPELMPTLVRLFKAAVQVVGTDLKAAIKWVQEKLRDDPKFAKDAKRIARSTYEKAARQAIDETSTESTGGLFAQPQAEQPRAASEATGLHKPGVEGSTPSPATTSNVALIDGRPYDMKRDNFNLAYDLRAMAEDVLPPDSLAAADAFVAEHKGEGIAEAQITAAQRADAEELLRPRMKLAEEARVEFDQHVIDIARATGALGQALAPIKSMKRAAEKLVLDEKMNVGGIKDLLRSTIIVGSYADAQKVVDAIRERFNVMRIKDRSDAASITGEKVEKKSRHDFAGYADVMVNVITPNGTVAEIQINVPAMFAAKEGGPGHKMYEIDRAQPGGSELQIAAANAQHAYYDAAFLAAAARYDAARLKNLSSRIEAADLSGSREAGKSSSPESANLNTRPSGNSTNSSPPNDMTNRQPSGNLSGTLIDSSITSSTSDSSLQQSKRGDYTGVAPGERNDDSRNDDRKGDAGQGAETVRGTQGEREAGGVPGGNEGGTAVPGGNEGAGNRGRTGLPGTSQVGPDGSGRDAQLREDAGTRGSPGDAGVSGPGKRAGGRRVTTTPAGRDIPTKTGRNYAFGPSDLTYDGSWPAKAEANVAAVELIKRLEKEGSQATRDEQAVLAKFIGWGASDLANNLFGDKLEKVAEHVADYKKALEAFAEKSELGRYDRGYIHAWTALNNAGKVSNGSYYSHGPITLNDVRKAAPRSDALKWLALRDRLQAALTEEEWAEASRSTQYGHYTSKAIVTSIWAALDRMGFKGGAVFEPGSGIGVFPGLMPAATAVNSSYTGIEYDSITGAILRHLFPDERIIVGDFIKTKFPKAFYDVAIGNPPFSSTAILADPDYKSHAFKLHDFFFAKSLDRVKPGGLLVFVSSHGTMDKIGDKARTYMAQRADLVGAIRLPQTAFKKNAGTEVVTDVLFLRRKVEGQEFEHAQPWLRSVPTKVEGQLFNINEYFIAHPEMVLGEHSAAGKMRGKNEYTVMPREGDIEAQFAAAVAKLPADVFAAGRGSAAEAATVRELDFNPKVSKEGNYYVADDGRVMQLEGGHGVPVEKQRVDLERIRDYIPLRDALKQAHYDQLNNGDWEASLAALQREYDKFTAKHGPINQFRVVKAKEKVEVDRENPETGELETVEETVEKERRQFWLRNKLGDDPDSTLVCALETVDPDTGAIKPSDFLSKRVLGVRPQAPKIETVHDALLSSLNDLGRVDVPTIAARIGLSEQDTIESLGTAIYDDPESGWVTADEYLSGNVRKKLEAAREAALADKRYERNIPALEAVQPTPRTASQINVYIGMNWIPGSVYQDFVRELTGDVVNVSWNAPAHKWVVETIRQGDHAKATADWGTADYPTPELLKASLTGENISVVKPVYENGRKVGEQVDEAATQAAIEKRIALRAEFSKWIWSDAARSDALVRMYNERFNVMAPRRFDGRHLTLPGTSAKIRIFDHVKRGAWRIIQTGSTYLAHAVGAGKTYASVISAMEQKRLGLIRKPMFVVPRHMLEQFATEWQQLYPAARLMIADERNFHTDNRRRFLARVAMSDLDGIVITHPAFKLVDIDPAFKRGMIEAELKVAREALRNAGGNPDEKQYSKTGKRVYSRDPTIKQIEQIIEQMEQRLEKAMSSAGKDTNVTFDQLGVDMLYVDEAHAYRKLDFVTARKVKGLSPAGSQRSFDLLVKTRWLDQQHPGRSLVMMSGTPITNTVAEMYTIQRFLGQKGLEEQGIDDFDSWASMFGRERTILEPGVDGKYRQTVRFNDMVNVPELTAMFRDFADVLTSDQLAATLGDERPSIEGGARQAIITPKTEQYVDYVKNVLQPRSEASLKWKPTPEQPSNPDPIINIITDGRLAAIDMRFADPKLPPDPNSKLNRLIDKVIEVAQATKDFEYHDKDTGEVEPTKGATMMVFSDLGFGQAVTSRRGFNARQWFESRLRSAGIPANQVAFMADAKKDADKLELFKAVNAGKVRILVGSSANMGTGVNAQQRLRALFHLDAPWFPADLEQREGRAIRKGNKNKQVALYAFSTKGTYDQQMWGLLASKQHFIDLAMSGDPNLREISDISEQSQMEQLAALLADDPRLLELAGMRADIVRLERLYEAHEIQRQRFRENSRIAELTLGALERALPIAEKAADKAQDLSGDKFRARAGGQEFTERVKWSGALVERYKELAAVGATKPAAIGSISGFDVQFVGEQVSGSYVARAWLQTPVPSLLISDGNESLIGMAMTAQNAVAATAREPARIRDQIEQRKAEIASLAPRLDARFPMAEQLADLRREARALENEIAGVKAAPAGDDLAAGTPEPRPVAPFFPWVKFSRGAGAIKVTISQSIADELMGRFPDDIPERLHKAGAHELSAEEARALLADAEFNADAKAGPELMSPGTRRAYAALRDQLRKALAPRASREVTKTEAFRKWFGESQVVDRFGEPMIGNRGTFDAGNPDIRMSQRPTLPERGRDAKRAVTRIRAAFGARKIDALLAKGAAGERGGLIVVDTLDDAANAYAELNGLPLTDTEVAGLRSGAADMNGFYDPASGIAFVIAEHAGDAASSVALHELGVHAWANDVPAAKKDALNARAAELVRTVDDPVTVAARKRMVDAGHLTDDGKVLDAEEAWAYLAEEAQRATDAGRPVLGRIRAFLADVVAAIRAALYKSGLMVRASSLTPRDLAAIARSNLAALARQPAGARRMDLGADLGKTITDAAAQAGWLAGEAARRGYRSVDELIAKDFAAFVGLAERWRAEHPVAASRAPAAPKPGEPFIVYRVGTEDGLRNANAGDAPGVAAFLAAGDDIDNPTVTAKGAMLHAYRVTVDRPIGDYRTVNAGRGAGDTVGRMIRHGGVQYSFPESGFTAEHLGAVPMSEVRALLADRGYTDFDDSGSLIGGEVIREALPVAERTGRRTATAAPGAATAVRASRSIIVGESKRAYTPEQKAYFTRVGRTVELPTVVERIKALRQDFGKRLAQGLVDQFRPLRDLSSRAYTLARLSKGSAGAFEAFLRHGKLSITQGGAYDADTSGGFLERVGVPLKGELDDFLWWVAANRAEQLTPQDREHLFTAADIAAGKSLADGDTDFDYTIQHGPRAGQVTRNRLAVYEDALATFNEFGRNALDIAEKSGLIDGTTRPFWEHEFYVPFYRQSDEQGGFIGPRLKSGLVRQTAFKQLKGGTEKLRSDLLANTLLNWSHLIDAAAKNRAAVAALDAAVQSGIAIEADEATVRAMGRSLHKRTNVAWAMDGGRERFFLVDDPYTLAAISSLEYAGLRGPLMDAMSSMKHWLTVGVTASPAFKVRNLIRDSVQAIATSDLNPNPLANIAEGLRVTARDSQEYVSALASGGLIRFGTMLEGSEADRVRQLVRAGVKDSTILNSDSKVRALYDRWIEPAIAAYNELGNRGEEVNRAALFNQLKRQGMEQAEAALLARDLIDFSMQGTWTGIRFLTQVVPFMNARMQGLYKLGRAAGENPQRFAAVVGAAALVSVALLAAYRDDDDWRKREEWDRDNYWWFKVGGIAYRIPKPFEVGAIATLAERGVEWFTDPEMTNGRLSKALLALIGNQLSMNPIPQAVKPVLDLYANKDSFTGRPIETMGMEKLRPDFRFTQQTSMLARGLSTAGNDALRAVGLDRAGVNFLSPVQIDSLVRGYFSWLGTMIVAGTDAAVRPLTSEPSRPAPDWVRVATQGFAAELPAPQSRFVTQLYDQIASIEEAYSTYRMMVREGRTAEAGAFLAENRQEIARYQVATKARDAMTRYNQQIRMIENSALPPDEKRARIEAVQQRKSDLARVVTAPRSTIQ